jgi:hypothetical protein
MTWKAQFIVSGTHVWVDSRYRFTTWIEAMNFAQGMAHFNPCKWRVVEAT